MKVNVHEEYEEYDELNTCLVSEPQLHKQEICTNKTKGISISAASLERFQSKG